MRNSFLICREIQAVLYTTVTDTVREMLFRKSWRYFLCNGYLAYIIIILMNLPLACVMSLFSITQRLNVLPNTRGPLKKNRLACIFIYLFVLLQASKCSSFSREQILAVEINLKLVITRPWSLL